MIKSILVLLSATIVGTHGFHTASLIRPALVHNRGSVFLIQSQRKNLPEKNFVLLKMSTPDDDSSSSEDAASSDAKDDDEDKTKLAQEYQVASIAYGITVASMLIQNGIFNIDILYSATGPFLGAALAYIVKGAAENDRLGSDTYKRLNLCALEYATCGFGIFCTLVVRALFVRKWPTLAYAFFGVANGLALVPSYKGWKKGVGEKTKLVDELWEGTKSSVKGLKSLKNLNALGYLVGTLFLGVATVSKLFDIYGKITSGAGVVAVGARIARFAKLSVLTGIMYTLKDAADRGRLEGTTFIELNFAVSLVCASMSAYWYEGILNPEVILSGALSVFTGLNGWVSVQKKKEKKAKDAET